MAIDDTSRRRAGESNDDSMTGAHRRKRSLREVTAAAAAAAAARDKASSKDTQYVEADRDHVPGRSRLGEAIAAREKAQRELDEASVLVESNEAAEGQESDVEAAERLNSERVHREQVSGTDSGSRSAVLRPSVRRGRVDDGREPGRFAVAADDDRPTRIRKFFGRNVLVIIGVSVLLISLLIASSISSQRSETLERQRSQILSKQNDQRQVNNDADKAYNEVVTEATGGVDLERKKEDDKVIHDLLDKALTWDGLAEYLDHRASIQRGFGLDEHSQFMTEYMPGEMAGVARKSPDGKMYYNYDEHMVNKLGDVTTWVTNVDGDVYSYAAVVSMRTSSRNGDSSAPTYSTLHYRMVDGKIADMVAETAVGGVTSSG